MSPVSPNHVYRLVWSDRLQSFVPAAESASGRGKAGTSRRARRARTLIAAAAGIVAGTAWAGGLPTGGQVTAGQASITQAGQTLTVNQATPRLITQWQSFSIEAGSTVNFVQPSAQAVALNRVLGADVSSIQGALNANGQVFLLNPNGVLFGAQAQVSTGGLVASTLTMSDADFLAGQHRLQGDSLAAVRNQGRIDILDGGSVALVAARVVNEGSITAQGGQVLMGAGSDVTLDLGGPVALRIDRGALAAQIDNGGAIRADGGQVLLTAKAADELSGAVINQTGVVQARTLATGERGEIMLLGDMAHGSLNAGGTLDASAPAGGDGGFIETSAAVVNQLPGLKVDAGAAHGAGGQWLIDPYNYTIDATAAGNIVAALNTGTSVEVSTAVSTPAYGAGASGSGDITVASAITKSAGGDATLTLRADRSIVVNAGISSTAGKLGITLSAANAAAATVGGVNINGNLDSNGGDIRIGGGAGTAVNGIGLALNLDTSTAAVVVQQNKTILSKDGDITINGRSLLAPSGGSYSGVKGGIYVKSGASILSGNGDLFITGESTNGLNVFGVGFEANSNTLTRIGTGQGIGRMILNAVNTAGDPGALGMVNNGG